MSLVKKLKAGARKVILAGAVALGSVLGLGGCYKFFIPDYQTQPISIDFRVVPDNPVLAQRAQELGDALGEVSIPPTQAEEQLLNEYLEVIGNYTFNLLNTENPEIEDTFESLKYQWILDSQSPFDIFQKGNPPTVKLTYNHRDFIDYAIAFGHEAFAHGLSFKMYSQDELRRLGEQVLEESNLEQRSGFDSSYLYNQVDYHTIFGYNLNAEKEESLFREHLGGTKDEYLRDGEPLAESWNAFLNGSSIPTKCMPFFSQYFRQTATGNYYIHAILPEEREIYFEIDSEGLIQTRIKQSRIRYNDRTELYKSNTGFVYYPKESIVFKEEFAELGRSGEYGAGKGIECAQYNTQTGEIEAKIYGVNGGGEFFSDLEVSFYEDLARTDLFKVELPSPLTSEGIKDFLANGEYNAYVN